MPAGKTQAKLNVFISYSRKDIEFVRRLVSALEARGIDAHVDERNLPAIEDWRRELLDLIRKADAVIVVISPDAADSPVCYWEVNEAAQLKKRFAPILLRPVPDDRVHEAVRSINYLRFDDAAQFNASADRLAGALLTDLAWVKEHTRLGVAAGRWEDQDRSTALLLRGTELEAAEGWIVSRPAEAPDPSDLHRQFIGVSRATATTAQRRQRFALLGAVAVLSAALIFAVVQERRAASNEQRAQGLLGIAVDVSRQMGGDVAERLSRTEGVPPDAVARVLDSAGQVVKRILEKQPDGSEIDKQRLTEVDIRTRAAAASFTFGDYRSTDTALSATQADLGRICPKDKPTPECALRAARLDILRAERLLWDSEQAQAKLTNAAAAAQEIAVRLNAKLDGDLGGELVRAGARARLIAADALHRIGDSKTAYERTKECIAALKALIDGGSDGPDRAETVLMSANCERAKAVYGLASGAAKTEEAKADLAVARNKLDGLRKDDPTNLSVHFAQVQSGLAEMALNGGATQSPDAKGSGNAWQALKKLIDENARNFQFRNVFLYLSGGLLAKEQKWLAGEALLSVLETRVAYLAERLRVGADRLEDVERRVRRRDFFVTLEKLYASHEEATSSGKIAELHDQYGALFDLKQVDVAETKDRDHIKATLFALAAAGRNYRAIGNEAKAAGIFLQIGEATAGPAKDALKAATDSWYADLMLYFWSDAIGKLGALRPQQIGDLSELDNLLKRAHDLIHDAWKTDEANYEFRLAYGNILASQALRAEKDNLARAQELYKNAAGLGSEAAINQLKNWVLNRVGPQAGDVGLAEAYERQRREALAVEETVQATSRLFEEERSYTVYLVAPKGGEDNVRSELQRLQRYYRVTQVLPKSESRLLDIMSRARKLGRNVQSISQRHIKAATEDRRREDRINEPYRDTAIAGNLKESEILVTDAKFGQALDTLNKARADVERRGTEPASMRDWGLLAFQYVKLWEALANGGPEDISRRAAEAHNVARRQIRELTRRLVAPERGPVQVTQSARQLKPVALSLFDLAESAGERRSAAQERSERERRDWKSATDEWNELQIEVLELGLSIGETLLRLQIADQDLVMRLAQAEISRGNALANVTRTNRGREAMQAFDSAQSYLNQLARNQADSSATRLQIASLLLSKAATQARKLDEVWPAVREAQNALSIATEVAQRNPSDLTALIRIAEAQEMVGQRHVNLVTSQIAFANKLSEKNDGLAANFAAEVLADLIGWYNVAEDAFKKANDQRIKLLRIDPAGDCACKLNTNINSIVGAMEHRLRLEKDRRARLKNPQRAEETMDIEKFIDDMVNSWRDVIKTIDPTSSGPSGTTRLMSDDEALFRYYISGALLRKAHLKISSLGTEKNGERIKQMFKEAQGIIADAVREMRPGFGRHSDDADIDYAVALGDLVIAHLMAGEAEKASEIAEEAWRVAQIFGLQAIDLRVNVAHNYLLNGKRDEAIKIYTDPRYVHWSTNGGKKNWRDQIRFDFAQLRIVYTRRGLDKDLEDIEAAWQAIDRRR